MRAGPWIVVAVALSGAASSDRLAAQTVPASAGVRCFPVSTISEVAAAGEACIPVWADSLRSAVPAHSSRARGALQLIGGRAAVDILRADFERAPTRASRRAVILAMGTTGSPEDVAFLVTQLHEPAQGTGDWFEIQLAATTLGLLRATAARDSLRAALVRNNRPNTF